MSRRSIGLVFGRSRDLAAVERQHHLVLVAGLEIKQVPIDRDLPASYPNWSERLVCSACGSREVDFVVSGERR